MKVQISVTVEVDPQEWAEEYSLEPKEVRADVKQWAMSRLQKMDGAMVYVAAAR